jgi:aldehyde dehydrogenase (NAD+)
MLSGQVCSSLTRIVVSRAATTSWWTHWPVPSPQVRVGDPFDPATQMGPLVSSRQRDRVEGYIAKGLEQGAVLVTGGGRPKELDRGYYVEPTVFADVDNSSSSPRRRSSVRCSP